MNCHKYCNAILLAALVASAPLCTAAESVLNKALEGARSVQVKYLFSDTAECKIGQESFERHFEREFTTYSALRIVDEPDIPDVFMTVNVDATGIPPGILPIDACMYFVTLRAVHPMYGRYSYKPEPHFLRALTFDRSAYSAIFPERLNTAVQIQAVRLLKIFFAAHGDQPKAPNNR